jgi:hypothetical protein
MQFGLCHANMGSSPILPVTQIAQLVEHYASDVEERQYTTALKMVIHKKARAVRQPWVGGLRTDYP